MAGTAPARDDALWADIQAQGQNMRRVVSHLYGPERQRIADAARFVDNDKPIVFIGMGSAAYLCMPAEAYLGAGGRFASTLYASEALYVRLPSLRRANVVLNTRSGSTVELVKLAEGLADAGIPFVAITNEPDSPVARLATHVVWSNTRKDDLVSINVVTAMMATTLLLAAEILGETEALRPQFERLADGLEDAAARAAMQAEELADLFEAIRPIYLLHRGASQGAAYCGRLVLEEVGRHPGVVFDVGDFRQGPIEVADARFGALIFVPDGALGLLSLRLAGQLHGAGGRVLAVGSATRLADCPQGVFPFTVAPLHAALRPVLEVVPLQLLAYTLAARQGYTPGTVRFISKVITSETEMAGL
jgi:glucosamine--fructose-6-phosphate aminotransferase (isomerizing)